MDGLIVERAVDEVKFVGVGVGKGRLRLQHTVVTGSFTHGFAVDCGADPFIVACRCVGLPPTFGGPF